MKKEVIIIGAGASFAAAEIPLGNELGWMYYSQCSTCEILGHNTDFPDKRKLERFPWEASDIMILGYFSYMREQDGHWEIMHL